MVFRIVKQLSPAPTSSVDRNGNVFNDPYNMTRENIWVAKLSGSADQLWEYSGSGAESNANTKAAQLSGSDSSGRKYKVIEV
jgi:hypothetical protein